MVSRTVYKLKPSSNRVWTLFGGEEVAGSLDIKSANGSLAEAKVGSAILVFGRKASLKKDLDVRENSESVGSFISDILSRGALTLHGHTYRWRPRNISWTEWAFETPHGFPVLRIRLATISSLRGTAVVVGNLEEKEGRFLALLGWYLLMLNHQDFDAHLRHVAVSFWKRPA